MNGFSILFQMILFTVLQYFVQKKPEKIVLHKKEYKMYDTDVHILRLVVQKNKKNVHRSAKWCKSY